MLPRYTLHFQPPAVSADPDKIIAGLVRARLLSEAVAFVSSDKQSVFLCVSVAVATTGSSLAATLITEACTALLAVKSSAPPPTASTLSITFSAALQPGAYLISAKVTGEQEVQASLQAGAAADGAQVFCQGTLSHAA